MPISSKIDCFITTHKNRSKEREYFLALTQLALHANGFSAKIVEEEMLERYYRSEYLAQSEIYILCDDDIVPATPLTLLTLVAVLRKHPEYSQLGLSWRRDMKSEMGNSWIVNKTYDGEYDIWEMNHIGGCMAIRKGTIRRTEDKCDYEKGIGDDKIMGKIAREAGYKVGIVPSLYFHHLGAGKSVVWK